MGKKLRSVEGGKVSFFCPGCGEAHSIPVDSSGWDFDGNFEKPTLRPSILTQSGHFAPLAKLGDPCWCTHNAEAERNGEKPARFKCNICHLHVTRGELEFLSDCTHALAGKTIPMKDVA